MIQCIEFREAKAELLNKYKDNFDFDELAKLAIDYSDGVIAAHPDVNEDLLKYAQASNIPTLAYPGVDFGAAYEALYEQICKE